MQNKQDRSIMPCLNGRYRHFFKGGDKCRACGVSRKERKSTIDKKWFLANHKTDKFLAVSAAKNARSRNDPARKPKHQARWAARRAVASEKLAAMNPNENEGT